jgi:hypothetical protein
VRVGAICAATAGRSTQASGTLAYVLGLAKRQQRDPLLANAGECEVLTGSGQIVEVDVERGGDLFQRADRAFALAVLDLR